MREASMRRWAEVIADAPIQRIRLAASTGNRAKEVLEQEDLIRRDDDGRWRLVDPVLAFVLHRL